MAMYRGIGGVNREIKKLTRGIGGVNRNILEENRGIGGTNKKIFGETVRLFDFNVESELDYFVKHYSPSNAGGWATCAVVSGDLVLKTRNQDYFIEPAREGLKLTSFEIQLRIDGRTTFMEGRINIYLTNNSEIIYCPINYSSIQSMFDKHLPYPGNRDCRCITWDGNLFHIGPSLKSSVPQKILFKRINGNMNVYIDDAFVGSMGDVHIRGYYIRTIRNWYNSGEVSSYIEYIKETE